jgi:hypothetical protein
MEACHPHEPLHWYLFIIGASRRHRDED